ncbi:MAG: lipoyl(octanoyl) transferase LipB [Pirellulales bacterium]|nr:lipoyl(octanoyl) transferase LipB [Pirellulales bacterium]
MSRAFDPTEQLSPAVETYLLSRIELQRCLELQQRLIGQIGDRDDGQIALLLCEHPPVITVGRGGSPGEIARDNRMLTSRQIEVRWVNRGGGCMVHCPGQLAVYPLVPLRWHGFSVGEYLERLQAGIVETLDDLAIRGRTRPGRFGVWGRTGQLAAFGVAVRNWVSYHGAFVNVCPPMGLFRLVEDDPEPDARMSCLVAERRGHVRMTTVRATLIRHLTEAFGCDRYHLYTGHPLLRRPRDDCEASAPDGLA